MNRFHNQSSLSLFAVAKIHHKQQYTNKLIRKNRRNSVVTKRGPALLQVLSGPMDIHTVCLIWGKGRRNHHKYTTSFYIRQSFTASDLLFPILMHLVPILVVKTKSTNLPGMRKWQYLDSPALNSNIRSISIPIQVHILLQ